MNKICTDRKGYDKVFHLALCFGLGCVLSGICSFIPFPTPWLAVATVFVLTLAVGVAKEILDSRKPGGHFCLWDLLADIIGIVLSLPVAYLANFLTQTDKTF